MTVMIAVSEHRDRVLPVAGLWLLTLRGVYPMVHVRPSKVLLFRTAFDMLADSTVLRLPC